MVGPCYRPGAITPLGVRHDKGSGFLSLSTATSTLEVCLHDNTKPALPGPSHRLTPPLAPPSLQEMDSVLNDLKTW